MKTILILLAHPALEKSRVNRALSQKASEIEGVTVHDLYELYPEFDIDVSREQRLLASHDLIILQHPLYWYSAPALLKQWLDVVLEYGWAYGTGGNALRGKKMLNAISSGGHESGYTHEGFHGATLRELLAPFRQTAKLCGLTYLPPIVTPDAFRLSLDEVRAASTAYQELLRALLDEALDWNAQLGAEKLQLSPAMTGAG